MNAVEEIQLEVEAGNEAATVLEQALAGAVVCSVGRPQEADDIAELAPAEIGAVLSVALTGDSPARVGITLAGGLLTALEQTLGSPDAALAAASEALLAAVATTGATADPAGPVADDLEHLAGTPGNRLAAVAILEGSERLATVVLRIGDDLAAPAPAAADPSDETVDVDLSSLEGTAVPHEFGMLDAHGAAAAGLGNGIDLIRDVELELTVVLGRAELSVRDLLAMRAGTVVELDQAAGSPVDVLVNGTRIARGEVVVIDEEFGIRISEIVTGNGIPR